MRKKKVSKQPSTQFLRQQVRQRGAVLISVMIYMLVLSMLGISSMRGAAMEAHGV
jgi:Tfp pilus assembly protein PilX